MLSLEHVPDRPKLADPVEATVEADQVYVRIGTPPSYIRLGARAWSIAELLDGSRTTQQVAHEASCTEDQVQKLSKQLRDNGLLVGSQQVSDRHDSDLHRQSLFFLKFTWHNPHILERIVDAVRPWVPGRVLLAVLTTLGLVGLVWCVLSWNTMLSQAYASVSWLQTWQVWPAILFRTVLHELGHAVVCLMFGRSVGAMGIGLYYFQPVAFTDVNDIWLLRERWRRVLVHLAGPIVDVALLMVSGIILYTAAEGALGTFAAYFFLTTIVGGLATLNPLLRTDGYFVLSEALREADLRERSLEMLATTAPWRLPLRGRRHVILVTYGVVCFAYTIFILSIFASVATDYVLVNVFDIAAAPQLLTWLLGASVAIMLWSVMLRRIRKRGLA